MLTRRQLLISAAVAPLAKFCRTEPVQIMSQAEFRELAACMRAYESANNNMDIIGAIEALERMGVVTRAALERFEYGAWVAKKHTTQKHVAEVRFALPPGTLG